MDTATERTTAIEERKGRLIRFTPKTGEDGRRAYFVLGELVAVEEGDKGFGTLIHLKTCMLQARESAEEIIERIIQ